MKTLAIQDEFNSFVQDAINGKNLDRKIILREATKEEAEEVLKQGGPDILGFEHEIAAEAIRHAYKTHGNDDEVTRYPDQRPLTKEDLFLIPAIIDEPTEIKVKNHGKNLSSIVYGRDFGNGKIYYVERIIETSQKNKPKLIMKTAWVKVATAGVKPSATAVYTPHRNLNIISKDELVKPNSV